MEFNSQKRPFNNQLDASKGASAKPSEPFARAHSTGCGASRGQRFRDIVKATLLVSLVGLILCTLSLAGQNPDDLYRQGRFAEAEKAYASADMDHPEDIRYRFNRGCAAYRNSDYKTARAAFSSVFSRSRDTQMRFRAAYNLGNTAFKEGDFAAAASFYKKALLHNRNSDDARHNLELALRGLADARKKDGQSGGPSDDRDTKRQAPRSDRSREQRTSPEPEKQSSDKDRRNEPARSERSGPDRSSRPDETRAARGVRPRDLSGDLKPLQGSPESPASVQPPARSLPAIDKKKAEVLLDNVKEGRNRASRLPVPRGVRSVPPSGRDW